MKRLLPAACVLAALAALGTGVARSDANSRSKFQRPSVKAVATARKRQAARQAEKLLRRFVLPPTASRLRNPPDLELLRYSGLGTPEYAELARRHGFWQTNTSFASVVAFVKAHRLPGFVDGVTSREHPGRPPANLALGYTNGGGAGPFASRMLTVTMIRKGGRTLLRVDAGAVWIYPRSPSEIVPAGVRVIDVHFGRLDVARVRRVSTRGDVARIIRWFNMLDIVQPGVFVRCGPAVPSPIMTFDFRSGNGVLLAEAKVPQRGYSTLCNLVSFSIRGSSQTRLMGANFATHVRKLLRIG